MSRRTVYSELARFVVAKNALLHEVKGAGQARNVRVVQFAAVRQEHLAQNPYLREFYGTVERAVRAIYTYHLGWFDGNATSLFPLSNQQRAQRMSVIAGGTTALLTAGQDALSTEDWQWAAELADHVLALEPDNATAMVLKADALEQLAEQQISANARNWYLSSAQWLRLLSVGCRQATGSSAAN